MPNLLWICSPKNQHFICKKEIRDFSNCPSDIPPKEKPEIKLPSLALSNILLRASITITNKGGAKWSPCLNPHELWKKPLGLPFTSTEKRIVEIQEKIHCLHLEPKPHLRSIYNKKFQCTWSYAFSKSSLHKTLGNPDLRWLSKHSLATNTKSRICCSLTKAFWGSDTT